MTGSIAGNILGLVYYMLYQAGGILLAWQIFKKTTSGKKLFCGSIFGTVMLQWIPVLFSFVFGFGIASHLCAVIAMAVGVAVAYLYLQRKGKLAKELPFAGHKLIFSGETFLKQLKQNWVWGIILPVLFYVIAVLGTHTIPMDSTGAITTGQCTYGDMNMHLGFITSIANQGTFPPQYSILPGTKLSYPFLCDSISSSIYLCGASLRVAYMLPMVFAAAQVLAGAYLLAVSLLKDKVKAMGAWIFFFFNGGFGFLYFTDQIGNHPGDFKKIFTEFYQAPTNITDKNLRWSNIIVDMLVPQRATLFGWAVLFGALFVLYLALKEQKKSYFVVTGLLAASLPMIHTHSFLAMGLICAVLVIYSIREKMSAEWMNKKPWLEYGICIGVFLLISILNVLKLRQKLNENICIYFAALGIAAVVVLCIYTVLQAWKKEENRRIIIHWGILLGIVILFALPQLFYWTFGQTKGTGFLKGHLNWSNASDIYLLFCIKNVGIVFILAMAAIFSAEKRKKIYWTSASMLIIFIAELVQFQPNDYDNNKLLYIAYGILCLAASDYIVDVFRKMKRTPWKYISATAVVFLAVFSAVLTMGREAVSHYELYNATQVELANYVEKNTASDATILTNDRHNNAIVSLAGRNIVCGSGSFLYFHGLDYQTQLADEKAMYENPLDQDLLKKYHIDYILVGPEERASYPEMREDLIAANYQAVFSQNDVTLYQVP